jgi:hypothetical protein
MTYRESLDGCAVAISTSESPDMLAFGLTVEHLRDAMGEIARHLLALGARLVYGGDLRAYGFTELLFELVARHRRDADEGDDRASVTSYLAWPVHIRLTPTELERFSADVAGSAQLVCLGLDGSVLSPIARQESLQAEPTANEWIRGLTAMRDMVRSATDARVVLGGQVDGYKGAMPGIAEETLLSLQAAQPVFLVGGFGGCARDIAETLGLIAPCDYSRAEWRGRREFAAYMAADLNNGLSNEENASLARTPHIDQAITLMLRGLLALGCSNRSTRGRS